MSRLYDRTYDVVVSGGGISGIAAGICAAREGARVLIIERNGYLGGALTGFGVGPMMSFFSGEEQVIKGFMQELVDRMVALGQCRGHVKDTTRYISYLTPFDAEGLKYILDEMAFESGCEVLFGTQVGGAEVTGQRIVRLVVCNKDGLNKVAGRVYVDATGDGDLMAWAGAKFVIGRPQDGASQPLTMNMKYCNVDTARLKAYVRAHPAEFPVYQKNTALLELDEPFACTGSPASYLEAKQAGRLSIPREDILMFETSRPGEYIVNTTRISGIDATDAENLSGAERIGRRQCHELDCYLRDCLPGFENALLEFTGPWVGVRASRRLVGRYTLTGQDILAARRFSSVVAHSAYPIDIHSPDGGDTMTHRLEPTLGRACYDLPFEIMLPCEIENLLVTGRCVSADFEAQAAIRVTPSAGALGQAAGIAAALAAESDGSVQGVDTAVLQKKLRAQGAFLDK
ncbi:FAD-dependent oxidoreductase [Ruminococcaceae bacterium OttesenSCG-928-D13]|nr:FAD-dependent oxidoreductase [Ruminococcaceae bacterium OttesenSCG-928-D13]